MPIKSNDIKFHVYDAAGKITPAYFATNIELISEEKSTESRTFAVPYSVFIVGIGDTTLDEELLAILAAKPKIKYLALHAKKKRVRKKNANRAKKEMWEMANKNNWRKI